ncbi:DUF1439 domain-containing protein [Marinomonas transparens]|uniref:DUF1439 domain-containing protein n=1 Tax=Marinomonas transparens TaxID=2795388 RepID=A0A934JX10_9GAMM|nr:DUF1439 domain-containing protein [Marinomonas transparens]MBJ7538774.1 DUF1439 domain-containing protein [Marinomonas transparens]
MRLLPVFFVVLLSLLLSGCNSFRVSEDEVNQEVAKRLLEPKANHIALMLGGNTLNLDLLVNAAHIHLTERDGGLVLVDMMTDMKGTLTAFGRDFSLTTKVNPSFESGVRLEENRVYLVAAKLTKVEVEGSSFNDQMLRSTLGPLHGDFEKALADYFNEHPVYVLDHSPFEASAAVLVKDIIIKEGELEFDIF